MMFTVVVTARAERDLTETGDWLYKQSPGGARRWIDVARTTIESLDTRPRRHSLAPENEFSNREIRNAFFKTRRGQIYRAVFYVENNRVVVTHIRGPRQRPLRSDEL